ncbi:hypothetical protein QTP70_008496 [Hemibagrus guttatus]|uniref:Uncharacterized protein n=1 Tax=Hemibagrus guttatus TaxID=175788 RepID=A0AAE0R214_9TELE|nr:hypothetical protein QTP70_008496 [Hemibagrus guttatus]
MGPRGFCKGMYENLIDLLLSDIMLAFSENPKEKRPNPVYNRTSDTEDKVKKKKNSAQLLDFYFQWITSFLTDRQQRVSLGKLTYNTHTISTGLIQDGDESAYRQDIEQLAAWCSHNNLELNMLKTVEMMVDLRKNPPSLPQLTIMDSTVAAVESFKFLGTTLSQDMKWDIQINSIVKKAQLYWTFTEAVLPSSTEKVQPATGTDVTVLLSCY